MDGLTKVNIADRVEGLKEELRNTERFAAYAEGEEKAALNAQVREIKESIVRYTSGGKTGQQRAERR